MSRIEWADIEDPWVDLGPADLINSPFVLPPSRRRHVVVVGEAPDDVEVEHTGCPLLEYPARGGLRERGYDCLVEWMLSDCQLVLVHMDVDPEDRSIGDFGTFVLRPGRWSLDVHEHTWTSYWSGPEVDYEVAIDEAGVVSED